MGGRGRYSGLRMDMPTTSTQSTDSGSGGPTERGHIDAKMDSAKKAVPYIQQELGVDEKTAEKYFVAVETYASYGYKLIRQYQNTKMGSPSIATKTWDLEKYIDRAPKWNGGETYRGITDVSDEVYKALTTKGAEINMNGTSSWSSKESVAKSFSNSGFNNIIFVSSSQKKGTSIQHLSGYGAKEAEVLVSNNAKYIVKKTKKQGNHTYVYVDEV